MFVDAELNFSFFVLLGNDEFAVTSEKELILYKIILNEEITDWQKYGRNTLGEGRGGGWVLISNDHTDKCCPHPEGWNVPH